MYTPRSVPTSEDALPNFLDGELRVISQAFAGQQPYLFLATLNVAPLKPREGQIVMADGTHWNPGSGKGFYGYKSGAWAFLG